jgi:biopolymer transport protein ExbD
MNLKVQFKEPEEAELEITSFMNLMIVLIPVLLLSMTFTQISVLDVKLPELTGGTALSADPQSKFEVKLTDTGINVFYPEDTLIKEIPINPETKAYDFEQLSLVAQEVKRQFPDKRDILVLSEPNVNYQNLVFAMDAVKSYQTVIAASVVEIELFPEISLGDAKKKE